MAKLITNNYQQMKFHIRENNFYLDDRKIFLNSGEIHYFRIKKELWDKHLDEAKEAGLRCISTYVPWVWHEPQENHFDFTGQSDPQRDLAGWLERCQARDLHCIVKPGPFILAEFRGAGLPDWFMERYREEVKMRTRNGALVGGDGVSLFNPVYLEKVTQWYDRIMPFIREREIEQGGPVILMQICNEIGVFSWLAHQADYGNAVRERFIHYLEKKYEDIRIINRQWATAYHDFAGIELPPDGMIPYASLNDRARDREWHLFWRRYYGDYLRLLTTKARERGVTVPLYHNLPGWIYGSGYEFPVNITMYDDLFGNRSEILFGVDHIPEFLSHRNQHDDRIINDITAAVQGNRPLFAAEFQCGSREYHVVTNPREMELFYKASIAHGLTGWNYYMFSQGKNPPAKGYSGDTFYWFNPLTADGRRTSAYLPVQRMNRLIAVAEPIIVEAERKAEVCVLFYPPCYATELERPAGGETPMTFHASAIRRPAWFDGLLKALQILNIDYDMADLTKVSPGELRKYRQVWVFATDEMDAGDQQTVVDYTMNGGQVILFPAIPCRDTSQQPCTILRDAIRVTPAGTEVIDSPLIRLLGMNDIKCANPQLVYDHAALKGTEIIARTLSGKPCGFRKDLGQGSVIHLGTWIGFDTEGHKPAYEALLRQSGARLQMAVTGSEWLTVRERFTRSGQGMLFVGNYYNEAHRGSITYTHPDGEGEITIPCSGGEINWPPLYGILSPLCLPVTKGIRLLHTTSDILGISVTPAAIRITLYGDRDLHGEIVLEGAECQRILDAMEAEKPVELGRDSGRVALTYKHEHQKEMILSIRLDG